jgi:beta-glucanase (GH16 family)
MRLSTALFAAAAALLSGAAMAQEPPATPPTDWPLSFDEEFGTAGPYPSAWMQLYPWGAHFISGMDHEWQYYVDQATGASTGINPFSISGNILSITADHTPATFYTFLENQPYTSGVINTYSSFSQTYGYFEARMRVPAGKGLWPTLWLMPTNNTWPPEIDIMESYSENPKVYHVTVHSPDANGEDIAATYSATVPANITTGYHIYGALWTPSYIAFYFDNALVWSTPTPKSLARIMHGGRRA